MKHSVSVRLALSWCLFISISAAFAHRPTFTDEPALDANTAISVDDIDISQVFYRVISEQTPQFWLTFEAQAGKELYVQIGVPVIDRLKDYRPAVAIVGPGLPEVSLPFGVPSGLGAKVISTDAVTNPKEFHEPFTDTRSWILKEERTALPATGRYYVVGYSPTQQPGKMWVSVGNREVFGLSDWAQFPEWTVKARAFHEASGGPDWLAVPCMLFVLLLTTALFLAARLVSPPRGHGMMPEARSKRPPETSEA